MLRAWPFLFWPPRACCSSWPPLLALLPLNRHDLDRATVCTPLANDADAPSFTLISVRFSDDSRRTPALPSLLLRPCPRTSTPCPRPSPSPSLTPSRAFPPAPSVLSPSLTATMATAAPRAAADISSSDALSSGRGCPRLVSRFAARCSVRLPWW